MGDPAKTLLLETMVRVIKENDLLTNAKVTGDKIIAGIESLQVIKKKNPTHNYTLMRTYIRVNTLMYTAFRDTVYESYYLSWSISWVPFYRPVPTLILPWISNRMPSRVWDEITYPLNPGCAVEV